MKILTMLFALLLVACSQISYVAKPDGSTEASSFSFGTTSVLEGAVFETKADGSRQLKIDSLNHDQVEGMKQINQGLMLIIEGAVKGAK